MEDRTKTEFSDTQYRNCYPSGIENNWWHLARNEVLKEAIIRVCGNHSKVLDIGCGRGITVAYLRAEGIDCQGVEVAETKVIPQAEDYVRVNTDATKLPKNERDQYNTVLLLDVIEHLPEPVIFLKNLGFAFPNLTNVIITVPGCPELWSNYDEFYGHFRRYTTGLLEQHAQDLKWELTVKGYFFHSVYIAAWMINLFKQKRETTIRAPQGIVSKLINQFIAYGMLIEYKILPPNLRGLSILGCFTLPQGHRTIDITSASPG